MTDYSIFPDLDYAAYRDIRGRATFPQHGTQPVWCDPTHQLYPICMAADFKHPPPTGGELSATGGTGGAAGTYYEDPSDATKSGGNFKQLHARWEKMKEVAKKDPADPTALPILPWLPPGSNENPPVQFCKDIAPCTNAKQFDGINAGIILPNFPSIEDIRNEEGKNNCDSRCADLAKIKNEECDMLRKRTALWLKNRGCPSIVRGYQKTKKRKTAKKANCTSCGNGKNGKKK